MNIYSTLKKSLTVALGLALVTSCMDDNDNNPDVVQKVFGLNIINAYSPKSSVQVKLDDVNLLQAALEYGKSTSGTLAMDSVGKYELTYIAPDGNQVLVDGEEITVKANEGYTSIIYGDDVPAKSLFVDNTVLTSGDENKPKIRFFNLAEGVEGVDVFLASEKIVTERVQETESTAETSEKFVESPAEAASTTITVKDADGEELATLANYNFERGQYYTIYLYGDGDKDKNDSKYLKVAVQQLRY